MKIGLEAWAVCLCMLIAGCGTVELLESDEYQVGDIGPAGGYIFYDDEADGVDDLLGVRYLEAAPCDLKETYAWGRNGDYLSTGGSRLDMGAQATDILLEAYPDANYAANACKNYRIKEYEDWFLPDLKMTRLLYQELKLKGLGGFVDAVYLSSGEDDDIYVEVMDFGDGNELLEKKDTPLKVRPVRSF